MNTFNWHHAPKHQFIPGKIHMVTGATLYKKALFHNRERLRLFQSTMLDKLTQSGWELHAWACFPNHYHFIGKAPLDTEVSKSIKTLHGNLSFELNRKDGITGRKVTYQYWDSCLSFDCSYYARLHYVLTNPVHHGVVPLASKYPFCSAAWFQKHHSKAECKKIASFPCDQINVVDDF
jgi:putative transposase